jgi:hypothetical protein
LRAKAEVRKATEVKPNEGQGIKLNKGRVVQLKDLDPEASTPTGGRKGVATLHGPPPPPEKSGPSKSSFTPSTNKLGDTPKGDPPRNAKIPPPPEPIPPEPKEGVFAYILRLIYEGFSKFLQNAWKYTKAIGVWIILTLIQMAISWVTNYVVAVLIDVGGPYYTSFKELMKQWYMQDAEEVKIAGIVMTPKQLEQAYNEYLPENLEVNPSRSMQFEVNNGKIVDYQKGFEYTCYGAYLAACVDKGREFFYSQVVPAEVERYTPGWIGNNYNETVPMIEMDSHQTNALLAFVQNRPPNEVMEKYINDNLYQLTKGKAGWNPDSLLIGRWKGPERISADSYLRLATQLIVNSVSTTDAYNQQVYKRLGEQLPGMIAELDNFLENSKKNPFDTEAALQAQAFRNATAVVEGIAQIQREVQQHKQDLVNQVKREYGMGNVKMVPYLVGIIQRLLRL